MAKRPNTAAGKGGSNRRSAFRSEFYADRDARKKDGSSSKRNDGAAGKRRRRFSVWVPVFGLSFLFCIIAVAGSSAMIWLRKLGAIFGVHWSGDL